MASSLSKGEFCSVAGHAAEEAGQVVDDAAHSSNKGVDETKDRLEDAGETGGDLYAKGVRRGSEAIDELPASFSDMSAVSERVATHGRRYLVHGVRKQPVETLLLAGAIGYLIGWAASRGQ